MLKSKLHVERFEQALNASVNCRLKRHTLGRFDVPFLLATKYNERRSICLLLK